MEKYQYSGPIDCTTEFTTENVRGKTAIVTGGSKGLGQGYVRALAKAGAFVVVADVDEEAGRTLQAESKESIKFIKTNVTNWEDQLSCFKEALAHSPTKRIDIVIANAGISGPDSVFTTDIDELEPSKPNLSILDIDLVGVLYTVKLALHYFRQQNASSDTPQDAILVLQGSLAGYIDLPGSVQYGASKYGLRSIMRNLRMSEWKHNVRVNYIAPWFIATDIITPTALQTMKDRGLEFATVDSAVKCLMRIASDTKVNGRAFAIIPYSQAPRGYTDLDIDDYKEGLLKGLQTTVHTTSHRADAAN